MNAPPPSGDLSQYATQEPPELLFFERANYNAVNIGLIAYGILIISFCSCVYYLVQERKIKQNWKWILYVTVLFGCGTTNISVNMHFNQLAWVDLRGYPGGPLMFLLQQQSYITQAAGNGVSAVIGFLVDALLIYRVHVVYQKWYVIVAPILAWLAATVLAGFWVAQASLATSSFWSQNTINFALPYFAVTMGLNILLTGMLVLRLLYMRYKITKALGSRHGETYTNIATMILESATPYGIVSFIFLVLYSMQNTAALLFIPLYIQVQCISPILIILRVARGRAWTKETISDSNLSRLRFGGSRPGGAPSAGTFKAATGPAVSSNFSRTAYTDSTHDVSLTTFDINRSYAKEAESV
ncbi:hypothetical protein BJ165DRAFT_1475657 [Panaeolus papilionaceus]|nr:hypothetical protein BJ165DRAFT_1475657 [Panaeolus papilionaceus]